MNDISLDIGQSKVATAVPVRQFGVVQAQAIENGSVQFVNMHGLLYRLESELIGGAMYYAALDSAASKQH